MASGHSARARFSWRDIAGVLTSFFASITVAVRPPGFAGLRMRAPSHAEIAAVSFTDCRPREADGCRSAGFSDSVRPGRRRTGRVAVFLAFAAAAAGLVSPYQADAQQSSNNSLESLSVDGVRLWKHNTRDWYVQLSGILSFHTSATLRFKLDDPTATCEVRQSQDDLVNTDSNLDAATVVLDSNSCSSNAENVVSISLTRGEHTDVAVLVTAENGNRRKHAVALNRPAMPNTTTTEDRGLAFTYGFTSSVGAQGGDITIQPRGGDAIIEVDYELYRVHPREGGGNDFVKLEGPDYSTPMPADGRVIIGFFPVDDQVEEDTETAYFSLIPAAGIPVLDSEVAILDNDVEVTFGAAAYTIAEGGTATVTVTANRDLGREYVIPLTVTGQNGATSADVMVPEGVTFTAGNTQVTFTLTVVDDSLAEAGESVELSFTGVPNDGVRIQSGGIATVTVSIESDDDMGGITVSPTALAIAEEDSATYTVEFGSAPTDAVTVTVEGHSGTDLTVLPTTLTFTSENWDTAQTIEVTASRDLDGISDTVRLMHAVTGGDYGAHNVMADSVVVTVMDDQSVQLDIPADGMVTVPEGAAVPAGTQVQLPPSVSTGHMLVLKEVAVSGVTDFPPGFSLLEGDDAIIVDITLVNTNTMAEVELPGQATVCLPVSRSEFRIYHYDDDADSPRWTALSPPSGGSPEGLVCGVTDNFSWFGLSAVPSAEPWLARFGRTVATHVVEAVSSRVLAPVRQQEMTLGGMAPQSALLSGALQTLSDDGTAPDTRELLSKSSFVLPLSEAGGARWTAWGRGAYTEFDGKENGDRLDGEVLTGTVGIDWARDRWLAGVAVSHSEGDGDMRGESSSEDVELSLTGAHPYVRYETEQGVSIWGMLGWAEGEFERKRHESSSVVLDSEVDLEMRMGAVGVRGRIASYKGFNLSLKSDALAMRLEADADERTPEVSARARRLRMLLEGAGHFPLESGGSVNPILEVGLRWDEGDAETGLGMELGTRMRYADAGSRLTAELAARVLAAHEENDYDEWGVGGSVRLRPDRVGRGLSLRLESGYGAVESTTGQLWSQDSLKELAEDQTSNPTQRFEMELGYGLNAAGLGLLTPYVGFKHLSTESVWRLGGQLELGEALSLELQGLWRSPKQAASEHELSVHVSGRW